jgi:hypothetical protein
MVNKKQMRQETVEEKEYTTIMEFTDKMNNLYVRLDKDQNGLFNIVATTKESTELHLYQSRDFHHACTKYGESIKEFIQLSLNQAITNIGVLS